MAGHSLARDAPILPLAKACHHTTRPRWCLTAEDSAHTEPGAGRAKPQPAWDGGCDRVRTQRATDQLPCQENETRTKAEENHRPHRRTHFGQRALSPLRSLYYGIMRPATAASYEILEFVLRRGKPVNETIVMLKRLSEAISQSNIESDLLASETYCSRHSSCNFSPKQDVIDASSRSRRVFLRALGNRENGGQNLLRT